MSQEQPEKPRAATEEGKEESIAAEISVSSGVGSAEKGGGVFYHNNVVVDDEFIDQQLLDYDYCTAQWLKIGRKNRNPTSLAPEGIYERGNITIGEALEATALTAGSRPVDYSDAAAIQAAEVRATGRTNIVPGGVAAAAQSAATRNARATCDEEKTKLSDILSEATSKLPADKPVTRRDAEGVIGAELRNDPNLTTRPGGVAASLAAAARINQINQNNMNKE